MILLIDNYDSFSYNLYQMLGVLNSDIRTVRNDAVTVSEIEALQPTHIVLSPGPGRPEDAGITMEVVRAFGRVIPILGVCLGHQAICASYGMRVTYAKTLMHGKASRITADTSSVLFAGLPAEMEVARYHSLAADASTLPNVLKVTATTKDKEVMAVEHRDYPVFGVQFHPESILTPDGRQILSNFLEVHQ